MAEYKLEEGWVRVRLYDGKEADLRCLRDQKGVIVKVYDYQGNELKHNTGARFVVWRDRRWIY
ncbi:hypothetical protein AVENLUH5627_03295 [Acinetobacter venetianus]|uniref:Uncharacterized protein n=1 Tax=Acinetobacter venetianus TaxID=52133 RepID=A0A150HJN9_9GAMM|nr:hypothetical protein [Acinetobacter venetianus]KXZ63224.1 hypothetical protein AVENLUH5627_03295 [Acinetobacter venetianus]